MKQKIIAVVGGKKVGKTTTIEKLIHELASRSYKVAVIKHISEPEFTIDTPGKDTYRFAQHGARTIIAMAPNEVVTIEKGNTCEVPLSSLLKKCKDSDVILIEGFKKIVAKKATIQKIVVVKSQEEAASALQTYNPILAFSGSYNTEKINSNIPYVDSTKNPKKLADIVQTIL
ncbi:MAG: molybdopterin-guanine dinucleotide biosynthesis protein B [Candidatus Bathyarchaeota archaeon]|nr:molybdopterin-guanine dinucleotide biosynthesis protein B [Candidatus Bathyarchaeota archaeon]